MFKRITFLAIAMAILVAPIGQLQSARADIIDKLVIKNDLAYGTVYYKIHKHSGIQAGCLGHRKEFSDGFLFKPFEVDFIIYRNASFGCPPRGDALTRHSLKYWAPLTTYTVSGSPDYPSTLNVTQQH
jgi:hypothetical protein